MAGKILVVDDSPTVVKFVSFSLKSSGYDVVTARDGMEAIEKLSGMEHPVDMVITDLNMPNLDGYRLIEILRGNEQHQKTPIVILSSEESQDDKDRGLGAGATSYLVKPFNAKALLEEVLRLLG